MSGGDSRGPHPGRACPPHPGPNCFTSHGAPQTKRAWQVIRENPKGTQPEGNTRPPQSPA